VAACASCFVLAAPGLVPWPFGALRTLSLSPWVRIPLEVVFLGVFHRDRCRPACQIATQMEGWRF